jgi:hypothetical protein
MISHLVVGALIIFKATKSSKALLENDFWQKFTGLETLTIKKQEAWVKTHMSLQQTRFDVYANEMGIYLVRIHFGRRYQASIIGINKSQIYPLPILVSDLADLVIDENMITFKLEKFFGLATEIRFSNTSLNDRNKIIYYIDQAKKVVPLNE